jgi:hypothetical protein
VSVELSIEARPRDLGGFSVRRVLPSPKRRLVGPFTFFDHIGPAVLPPGGGVNVRPHPHIGLATVTYLFEGELWHRDSLGSELPIRPGAVNWMLAGRGVVHSERSGPDVREHGGPISGIQAWVALPSADEELPPSFEHHPADTLPTWAEDGARFKLLAGSAYGREAPVGVRSPTFYVEVHLETGAALRLPEEHAERAAYVVAGRISCGPHGCEPGRMLVLGPGAELRAEEPSHVMLIGGAPLDGDRYIWWNLVSSRPERIEQADLDWREGRFPVVPGDEIEFIPAPDERPKF